MLFGDSTPGVVASLLRSCIKARAGTNFCVADFAQIEARVVAWLGGQRDILDVFQSGEDVYVYTAEKIGSTSRDLGKVLVLACGFGMGWAKFQETAKTYRLDLTEDQAREYVKAWRDANPHIVQFWWDCDAAARAIAGEAKAPIRVGEVVFRRVKNSMLIRLPSGRDLVYRGIRLEYDDEGKSSIVYQGTNQITKKWGPVRTYGGKIVENITQAVARDVLRDTLKTFKRLGLKTVLTIHDELLVEQLIAACAGSLATMLGIMSKPPVWAPTLPVGAAGWIGPEYKKV